MKEISTKVYYELLKDLTLCNKKEDLLEIETRISEICKFEIDNSDQVIDPRNSTFTVLIEKINNMYSFKLKLFSDEYSQKGLNKWTFLLAIGTFLMVLVSGLTLIQKNNDSYFQYSSWCITRFSGDLNLAVAGLFFEIFGAITLIYTLFIKRIDDFIKESSCHNSTLVSRSDDKYIELNISFLESNITQWKNSWIALIFLIIGFLTQLIGQYNDRDIFSYLTFLVLFISILFLNICIFNKLKKRRIRNILISAQKNYGLLLGRNEIRKFIEKYFPEKDDVVAFFNSLRK